MRIEKRSHNYYAGFKEGIINAIKKTGAILNKPSLLQSRKLENLKYCKLCYRNENRSRYKTACSSCNEAICPAHSFLKCPDCRKKN